MMILLTSLFMVGALQETPIVCNLNALTAADRQQHLARSERLKSAVTRIEEVAEGYRLHFGSDLPAEDLLRWIEAERRCCAFLDFELRLERENRARWLQLTGREEVKAFLRQELRAQPDDVPSNETGALPTSTTGRANTDRMPSSQIMEFFVALIEKRVVGAAEAMPANKYPFAPSIGEFAGVRTFAQQVKHLAATNHILAAGILGEPRRG